MSDATVRTKDGQLHTGRIIAWHAGRLVTVETDDDRVTGTMVPDPIPAGDR